jgi:hypothetical protein
VKYWGGIEKMRKNPFFLNKMIIIGIIYKGGGR